MKMKTLSRSDIRNFLYETSNIRPLREEITLMGNKLDIVDGKIQIKSEDGTEKNIENGPGVISIKLDEIIIALESGTLS